MVAGSGLPSIELVGHKQNPFVSLRVLKGPASGDTTALGEFKTSTVRRGGTDPEWADAAAATETIEVGADWPSWL